MSIQIPRERKIFFQALLSYGSISKGKHAKFAVVTIIKKFVHQFLNTLSYFYAVLVIRQISYKKMYSFQDRGERSLTLRPEGTAPVVRSYVENKMFGDATQPTKLYYIGQMFRYERPQAGRYRQFVQFGIEAIGSNDPAIDAEVIALAVEFYRAWA